MSDEQEQGGFKQRAETAAELGQQLLDNIDSMQNICRRFSNVIEGIGEQRFEAADHALLNGFNRLKETGYWFNEARALVDAAAKSLPDSTPVTVVSGQEVS